MGPIRLDEYGKPVLTIYVRKVERNDGRLVNSIVATYPAVTQFFLAFSLKDGLCVLEPF